MFSIFKREIKVPFLEHGVITATALTAVEWAEVLQKSAEKANSHAESAELMIRAALRWVIKIEGVTFEDGTPFTIKDKEIIPPNYLINVFNAVLEQAQPQTKKSEESVISLD